jgi:ElaB/YqjD/DUF883 family membrane-anchored ribosome-binding protein
MLREAHDSLDTLGNRQIPFSRFPEESGHHPHKERDMSSTHEPRSLGSKLDAASDNVENLKQRLKGQAEDLVAQGQERLDEVRGRVTDSVRERPLATLLAAGGVGLLLGLLISRRS